MIGYKTDITNDDEHRWKQKERLCPLAYSYFSKDRLLVVSPHIPLPSSLEYLSCIYVAHHGKRRPTNHMESTH